MTIFRYATSCMYGIRDFFRTRFRGFPSGSRAIVLSGLFRWNLSWHSVSKTFLPDFLATICYPGNFFPTENSVSSHSVSFSESDFSNRQVGQLFHGRFRHGGCSVSLRKEISGMMAFAQLFQKWRILAPGQLFFSCFFFYKSRKHFISCGFEK